MGSKLGNEKTPPTWPFKDPPNLATITLRSIIEDGKPILAVFHSEAEDWQFLDGSETLDENEARVVGLREIVDRDSSLLDLADLPVGLHPWRAVP